MDAQALSDMHTLGLTILVVTFLPIIGILAVALCQWRDARRFARLDPETARRAAQRACYRA